MGFNFNFNSCIGWTRMSIEAKLVRGKAAIYCSCDLKA